MKQPGFLDQWLKGVDFNIVSKKLNLLCIEPYKEVYDGIFYRRGSILWCMVVSICLQLCVLFYLDWYAFKLIGKEFWYPVRPFFRWPYLFAIVTASFYFWGIWQVGLRTKITRWLTEVFRDASIKSVSGKLPSFISDKAIDNETRLLRLKKNGTLKAQYEPDKLGQLLRVEIDRVVDDSPNGAINIYYSHALLEEKSLFKGVEELREDQFFIGKSRTNHIIADLKNCPHYLIGGATGGGKSYFLSQVIMSLYLKNPEYTFELIDLKSGSDFETRFSNLPRVNIHSAPDIASVILGDIAESEIKNRVEFLKLNGCQDVDELRKVPDDKLKFREDLPFKKKFDRRIIVVDEAHELFLKYAKNKADDANLARHSVIRIAALGRSVGIHILVGTQRPDAKAVDPLIKTNLQGRVCFFSTNNATSMTILDNSRGAHLPDIKGRCIWKNGSEMKEVQSLYLSKEVLRQTLKPHYIETSSATEKAVDGAPDSTKAAPQIPSSPQEIET